MCYMYQELPWNDESKLKEWLLQTFVEKDKLLKYRYEHGTFPKPKKEPFAPKSSFTMSLIIWCSNFVIAWAGILYYFLF